MEKLLILFLVVSLSHATRTRAAALSSCCDSLYMQDGGPVASVRSDSVAALALPEVTVEAARVVRKPDGQLLFPSAKQLQASTNGYSLLAKLVLPRIRVDEVARTITPLGNNGSVQLRLNGAITTHEELLSLDPKTVKSVDFIDNPGVRYGEGIGYVIDIRTRRGDSGWLAGADLNNSLTARHGSNTVFGKANRGNSEFGLTYQQDYTDFRGNDNSEQTDYLLNNGTLYHVSRTCQSARSRSYNNSLQAKYSLADSASYVFQAVLTNEWRHDPGSSVIQNVSDNGRSPLNPGVKTDAVVHSRGRSSSFTPALDLYFMHTLGSHQTLTANAVGTGIATEDYDFNDEGSVYEYAVKGRTWSLLTEAVYENRLRPFTVSLGMKHSTKYTRNEYTGSVASLTQLHNSSLYVFGEIKGRWKGLSYVAGLGVSHHGYRQGGSRYSYWLFRPKTTVSYAFTPALSLRYSFEMYEHVSRIAFIGGTAIRTNVMEWTVGNPDLKPNKVFDHVLTLSYDRPRLSLSADFCYRTNPRPNMAYYVRTADDRFVYTQRNQKDIRMVYGTVYARCDILPERLTANLWGGVFRFFNYGDNYRHYLTTYNFSGSLNAYLGRWTLVAAADNGWKFMEGETMGHSGSATYVGATCHIGNFDLSVFFQHPFEQHPRTDKSIICNEYMHKVFIERGRDYGNMLTFNLTWKMQWGRKYKSIRKTLQNRDSQTGIMQGR